MPWGFGFKKGNFPDSAMIDSLLEMTGYEKVKLSDEGKVMKTDPRIMLSCSAVAKGYAVDVIAQLLKKKGYPQLYGRYRRRSGCSRAKTLKMDLGASV